MKHLFRLALVVAAVGGASACITDVKGTNCGFLDAFVDSEGQQYCPDEAAPDDCTELFDTYIAAAVACTNGAVTEEQIRDEVTLPDCASAVATTTDFDACVDDIDAAECEDDLTLPLPDTCKGAILLN